MADQRIDFDTTGAQPIAGRIDFDPSGGVQEAQPVGVVESAARGLGVGLGHMATGLGILGAGVPARVAEAVGHPEVADKLFAAADDFAKWADQAWGVKPTETQTLPAKVAGTAAQMAPALGLAAVTGGATGAAGLMGGGTAAETYAQNLRQGVAPETAAKQAALAGTLAAGGAVLPAAVPGRLLTRVATGAGIGAAQTEVGRVGSNIIYGQDQYADMQRPFEPSEDIAQGIVGGAMGGLFGGRGAAPTRGARKAAVAERDWQQATQQMQAHTTADGDQVFQSPSGAWVTRELWDARPDLHDQWMTPAAQGEAPPPAAPSREDQLRAMQGQAKTKAARQVIGQELKNEQARNERNEMFDLAQQTDDPQLKAALLAKAAEKTIDISGVGPKRTEVPAGLEAPETQQITGTEAPAERPAPEGLGAPEPAEAARYPEEQAQTQTPEPAKEIQLSPDEWRKQFGLTPEEEQLAIKTRQAWDADPEATEAAARQHEQDPIAYGNELQRIIDESQSRAQGGAETTVQPESGQPPAERPAGGGAEPAGANAAGDQQRAEPAAAVPAAERPVQRAEPDRTGATGTEQPEPVRGAETTDVAPGRGRALSPNEMEVRVVPSADVSGLRKLGRTVRNMTIGKLNIPDKPITSLSEAATALAPMRRDAQEQVMALVTDKDGKPLTVIRHTKGGPAASQLFWDSLIPAIARVKGAANVYLAHNHPSGKVEPSAADRMVQSQFEQQLQGSGIEPRGHIIIGPGGKTTMFRMGQGGEGFHETRNVPIEPALRRATVGISEPQMRGGDKPWVRPIDSPDRARQIVTSVFKPEEYGVVFTDAHNRPVGVLPMTSAEMGKLRTGDPASGYGKLMSAAGEVGAQGAILKGEPGREPVTQNLGRALKQTGIEVLDVFHGDRSAAEHGEPVRSSEPAFESRAGEPAGKTFESPEALEQHLRDRFGDKLIDGLQKEGVLKIDTAGEDRPGTRGLQRGEEATLFHDRLTPETAPGVLMHEVGEHYGMERILGAERYKIMLDELAKSNDPAVQEARAKVEEHYGITEQDGERYWREVAAHLTEDAPQQGFVRRLVNDMRAFLYDKFGTSLGNRVDANLIRGMATAALRKAAAGGLRDVPTGRTAEYESKVGPGTAAGGPAKRITDLGEERWNDRLTERAFDRLNRMVKGQQVLEGRAGKPISEKSDVILAETLRHGRAQEAGEKLNKDYIEPLGKLMQEGKKEGLTVKDADMFLMAKHAPERNSVIASRNPAMLDGGSGLTNKQAADILSKYTPEQTRHLDKVADLIYKMNGEKLDQMVDNGLIKSDTRDALKRQYKYYVPLKSLDAEDAARGVGQGYHMHPSDITAATGRKSVAGSPIAASIADASRAIVRGEKARVDKSIWSFANEKDAKGLIEPYDAKNPPQSVMTKKLDSQGQVKYVVDPSKLEKQTLSLVVDGEPQRVYIGDEKLTQQLKNLNAEQVPEALRKIGKMTSSVARMFTEFNPAFAPANAVKDTIIAAIRAGGHEGMSAGKLVAKLPEAYAEMLKGGKDLDDFKALGGKTGAYGLKSVADTMGSLERAGAELGYKEHEGYVPRHVWNGLAAVAKGMSHLNEIFEYSTRLAAYKSALEAGMSPQRAAQVGKEITVNFNRAGTWGRPLNSVFAFANASLQGLYGTLKYAKSPTVRRAMYGLVAMGALTQWYNENFGGKDEETGELNANSLNDFTADNNIMLLKPGSRTGIKIPLPPEISPLYTLGRRAARMISQGNYRSEATAVIRGFLDGVSPVRIGDSDEYVASPLALYKAINPTLLQPFVDVWTNKDYFGGKILPEQHGAAPAPWHTIARKSTSDIAKTVSQSLNSLTGGDDVTPGWFQASVGPLASPEAIEHIASYYTGGAGKFLMQSSNIAKGESDVNKIPILNRFYFDDPKSYIGRRYREVAPNIAYAEQYMKKGDVEAADPKALKALDTYKEAEAEIRGAQKEIVEAAASGNSEQVDQIRDRIRAAQARVIKAYNQ